jgi:hypothetical protein
MYIPARHDVFWYNSAIIASVGDGPRTSFFMVHGVKGVTDLAETHGSFYRRCGYHRGLKGTCMADFQTVKSYVHELHLFIVREDPAQHILIVQDDERGINNLVIDCEEPILIFEQMIMDVPPNPGDMFRRLLQMNRMLVHGAFALTEDGKQVLFRDTLRIENLDLNEMQGTIEALSLAMAEHAAELIAFSQQ